MESLREALVSERDQTAREIYRKTERETKTGREGKIIDRVTMRAKYMNRETYGDIERKREKLKEEERDEKRERD